MKVLIYNGMKLEPSLEIAKYDGIACIELMFLSIEPDLSTTGP